MCRLRIDLFATALAALDSQRWAWASHQSVTGMHTTIYISRVITILTTDTFEHWRARARDTLEPGEPGTPKILGFRCCSRVWRKARDSESLSLHRCSA